VFGLDLNFDVLNANAVTDTVNCIPIKIVQIPQHFIAAYLTILNHSFAIPKLCTILHGFIFMHVLCCQSDPCIKYKSQRHVCQFQCYFSFCLYSFIYLLNNFNSEFT
jgi:hypothetical protein